MLPEFVRCLKKCQPEAFILENVPGLTQKGTHPYFESVLAQLTAYDYRLNWSVLNAADYGIPQKRKRLFIVGSRQVYLRFPAVTHDGTGTDTSHVGTFDILGSEL